ncbi:cyclic nucleotide-binding domain-containing protein [Nocardioides convexus]|uniref:cyclic nucleotide-binding domain-containing protein n=1 Tax=Nocardioides convexus TaxID=2712224 RepID=UPI002418B2B4|nr:cyclic nucleotide-binding domain-containing protein [Nocardioides convexus]
MATFFEHFTPEEIARISATGRRVKLPEGWSPIWEDTPADKAYILLAGTVSVRRDGRRSPRLGPGDIVGEAAIVGQKPAHRLDRRAHPARHHPPHRRDPARDSTRSGRPSTRPSSRSRSPASATPDPPRYDGVESPVGPAGDGGVVGALEEHLLGEAPRLTQQEVADQAGVSVETAREPVARARLRPRPRPGRGVHQRRRPGAAADQRPDRPRHPQPGPPGRPGAHLGPQASRASPTGRSRCSPMSRASSARTRPRACSPSPTR